jgi:hypothetical protein
LVFKLSLTPNLVVGMKWLLSTYTSCFNRRHKLFGHLFSGRYKSLIVEGSGSGYLKSVSDYVHLNPARAKLVVADAPLKSFAWSSWPAYLLAARARETPGVVAGGSVAGRVGHARGQSGGAATA